jgi:hypothetical protein
MPERNLVYFVKDNLAYFEKDKGYAIRGLYMEVDSFYSSASLGNQGFPERALGHATR